MSLATALSTLLPTDPRYPDCRGVPPVSVDLEVAQYPTSNPLIQLRRLVQEDPFEALKTRWFVVRLVDILLLGSCK